MVVSGLRWMLYLAVSAAILAACPIVVVLILAWSHPQAQGSSIQMVVHPVPSAAGAAGR